MNAVFKRTLGVAVLAGAAAFGTTAAAEVAKMMHHDNGHEAVYSNGCVVAFRSDGEYYENTEVCTDKQIDAAKGLMVLYLAAHKNSSKSGSTTSSGSTNKNAKLTKKGDGTFEVVWKTDCIADFNKKGEATFLASTCDDNEIATSTSMVKKYIASH
jgi:predicted metal-binding protein